VHSQNLSGEMSTFARPTRVFNFGANNKSGLTATTCARTQQNSQLQKSINTGTDEGFAPEDQNVRAKYLSPGGSTSGLARFLARPPNDSFERLFA
jgi:hypothetical protein